MTNQALHGLEADERHRQQAEGSSPVSRNFYADLSALENLQQAYAHLKDNFRELGIDPLTFEAIAAEGVEPFLKQLRNDLHARTYQPTRRTQQSPATSVAEGGGEAALRDLVVQAALERLLESAFPPAFPTDSEPDETIQWLAGKIDKGLSRVFALNIHECLYAKWQERLVERAGRRIEDPQLIGLLKEVLAASAQPNHPPQGLLAPLLADIALEGIDQILLQARTLGREGNFHHVQCTRVADELVVVSDRDPRYDWLLPAVQKRLREELSNLHFDPAAVETQSVDLTCGDPVYFLGFELRLVTGRGGKSRVHCRLLEEGSDRRLADGAFPRRRRRRPRGFVRRCVDRMVRPLQLCGRSVHDAYRQVNSVQVGWRHLPITVCPVLLYYFGWRSPYPWLCFLLIFVCNWRWTLGLVSWLGGHARRRWPDVGIGACALVVLACLVPWMRDIYAIRPQEVSAPAPMPSGFYEGRFQGDSWWDSEPTADVAYGLYVPPHLQDEKGPFPLLVFLHPAWGRNKSNLFKMGFLIDLANRFGKGRNGRLDFVVFAPIDPTGRWLPQSAPVEDMLRALDYVMARHAIDPARVSLTGFSEGGDGVWRLAETYPDRWAALAPVLTSYQPDVAKVRHIPAWIFDAGPDRLAAAAWRQTLLAELRKVGTDGRYEEIANNPQPWIQVYRSLALYDWLATKKKIDERVR